MIASARNPSMKVTRAGGAGVAIVGPVIAMLAMLGVLSQGNRRIW
jgi:hypothetical protein